jgi:TrmH family RNA methyltransferase
VVVDLLALLRSQRKKNVQILAASANGKSFWEYDLTAPTIFLLGNEGAGLSSELRAEATDVIAIPMAKGVESLNVAVTGALLLFEAQRQRKTAPKSD